jgi:hypothetical protein
MSYCRIGAESDVYMYHSASTGLLVCGFCNLISPDEHSTHSQSFVTHEDAIEHLHEHIAAGDKVPARAIAQLQYEIDSPSYPARDRLFVMPVYADLFARYCPGVGWCWPCKGLLYMANDFVSNYVAAREAVDVLLSMRDFGGSDVSR